MDLLFWVVTTQSPGVFQNNQKIKAMKDRNGTTIKEGDKVHCNGLEFIIKHFQTAGDHNLACGDYGCLNVNLLEKVEKEKMKPSK